MMAPVKILVVGFGPFVDVAENPAAALARSVDGLRGPGVEVVGRELPVSYARAPELTRTWAAELSADLVLGIGVASRRTRPEVERVGRRRAGDQRPDADGERPAELAPDGPDELASPQADAVAKALRVETSDDAGRYVCNAWLYRSLRNGLRAAFLHVPPAGQPNGMAVQHQRAERESRAEGGQAQRPSS